MSRDIPTNANEVFEAAAAQFRLETGMMAPGKDEAEPGAHTYEERMASWKAWSANRMVRHTQ